MIMGWFRSLYLLLFLAFCLFSDFSAAQSIGNLRVTPVLVDIQAPVMGSSLTMSNNGGRPITVQVRIFKWSQQDGENLYTPAKGVAVSPPMMILQPNTDSILRIVRTATEPLIKEESYRLVVDQLPDSKLRHKKGTTVSFVVRHNIPVFFSPAGELEPQLSWKAVPVKGGYQVMAINNGTRHIGIAEVKLWGGQTMLGQLDGLAGYALAGSSGSFFVRTRSGEKPNRIQAVDTARSPIDDVIRH